MSDLETEREAISEHQIGEVAGMIWRELAEHGDLSPAALARRLSISPEAICMAIGWLAREEKLNFANDGGDCAIRLR